MYRFKILFENGTNTVKYQRIKKERFLDTYRKGSYVSVGYGDAGMREVKEVYIDWNGEWIELQKLVDIEFIRNSTIKIIGDLKLKNEDEFLDNISLDYFTEQNVLDTLIKNPDQILKFKKDLKEVSDKNLHFKTNREMAKNRIQRLFRVFENVKH